jgi:hypothetical protein
VDAVVLTPALQAHSSRQHTARALPSAR